MRSVRTARSNFVWTGPTPDVGDLHSTYDPDVHRTTSVWELTPEEREAVAKGANIALGVYGLHPPVMLYVTDEQGVGEDAPELQDRLRALREREATA